MLISGRNFLDLATKEAREYKKAFAFNEHTWDSLQMKSKHSGDTVQDCIEYVRREMYKLTVGGTMKKLKRIGKQRTLSLPK